MRVTAQQAPKAGLAARHKQGASKALSGEEKWLHSHLRLAAEAAEAPHDVIMYGDDIVEAWRCALLEIPMPKTL